MSKETTPAIEAEIVKDNDGKKARQKAKNKRTWNDVFAPILVDFVLLALGVSLLIWADKVTDAISITIGVLFIIYGAFNFIKYLRAEKKSSETASLITAIALTIAGVFLSVQTGFVKEAISFIVGLFIVIVSIIKLQDALAYRALGPNYRLPMILSIIGLAAGVLCIVGKIMISDIIMQILGVMLIIFSVSNIANSVALNKLKKS